MNAVLAVLFLGNLSGHEMNRTKVISKYVLASFMIAAGTTHFVNPEFFLKIMPPYRERCIRDVLRRLLGWRGFNFFTATRACDDERRAGAVLAGVAGASGGEWIVSSTLLRA